MRSSRLSSSVVPDGGVGMRSGWGCAPSRSLISSSIPRERAPPGRRASASSRFPSAISSARLAGSFSLPVACATSFWRRRPASTALERLACAAPPSRRGVSSPSITSRGDVPVPAVRSGPSSRCSRTYLRSSMRITRRRRGGSVGLTWPAPSKQVGAGLDAAVEVGQGELLVRPVQVVVVLAPAEQERIDAELRLEQADDGDRAPFADEDRRACRSPPRSARDRRVDAGAVDGDQHGGRALVIDDLVGDARRADGLDVRPELPATVLGVLVGHEAEAELRAGLAGQDRLGARPLVAAEEPVDVAGRPGPVALERRVARLAFERRARPASSRNSSSENGSLANSARSQSSSGRTSS